MLIRRTSPLIVSASAVLSVLLLAGCSSLSSMRREEAAVVYALGARESDVSPLDGRLSPVFPALTFQADSHAISGRHLIRLRQFLEDPNRPAGARYLVAGFAEPGGPMDYARSLSERRAQAVRQWLIENGMDAQALQTVGYGADFASRMPSASAVVVYQTSPLPAMDAAPPEPPPAE
jgi:outer membrane protein OmpA-like peptidoglycan-associated protein